MKMIDRIVERLEEHQEKWCRNKELMYLKRYVWNAELNFGKNN